MSEGAGVKVSRRLFLTGAGTLSALTLFGMGKVATAEFMVRKGLMAEGSPAQRVAIARRLCFDSDIPDTAREKLIVNWLKLNAGESFIFPRAEYPDAARNLRHYLYGYGASLDVGETIAANIKTSKPGEEFLDVIHKGVEERFNYSLREGTHVGVWLSSEYHRGQLKALADFARNPSVGPVPFEWRDLISFGDLTDNDNLRVSVGTGTVRLNGDLVGVWTDVDGASAKIRLKRMTYVDRYDFYAPGEDTQIINTPVFSIPDYDILLRYIGEDYPGREVIEEVVGVEKIDKLLGDHGTIVQHDFKTLWEARAVFPYPMGAEWETDRELRLLVPQALLDNV